MLLFGLKAGLILSLLEGPTFPAFLVFAMLRTLNLMRLKSPPPVLAAPDSPGDEFSPVLHAEIMAQHAAWLAGAARWAVISRVMMIVSGLAVLWVVTVKRIVTELFIGLTPYNVSDGIEFSGGEFGFVQGLLLLALLYFAGVGVIRTAYNR